jgi:hypothetical protein
LYDQRIHGEPYRTKEYVWLHSTVLPGGTNKKLYHPWTGPFVVVKKLLDAVYRIQSLGQKRKRLVVHFNRLKPCSSVDPGHCGTNAEDATIVVSPRCQSRLVGQHLEIIEPTEFPPPIPPPVTGQSETLQRPIVGTRVNPP